MAIWGHTDKGEAVPIYTLTSGKIEVRVTAYGARLVSIKTPDRNGKVEDIVLGYDSLQDYLQPNPYFGAIVGRYGNRIGHGKFSIDGKTYQIPLNNGPNALHGGPVGFDQHVWQSHEVPDGVEFTHVSPDGDMGFPGKLTAKVKYTLTGNTLRIDYYAVLDPWQARECSCRVGSDIPVEPDAGPASLSGRVIIELRPRRASAPLSERQAVLT